MTTAPPAELVAELAAAYPGVETSEFRGQRGSSFLLRTSMMPWRC